MSDKSIAHIFLEANPESALAISTGYDQMFAQLADGHRYYQFFGSGETVADALQSLDADIKALGISVESFAFAGHTQQEHDEARENAIAEMRQQIAEEEAAMEDARENGRQEMFLRLTEEVGMSDEGARQHIAHLERLAEVML